MTGPQIDKVGFGHLDLIDRPLDTEDRSQRRIGMVLPPLLECGASAANLGLDLPLDRRIQTVLTPLPTPARANVLPVRLMPLGQPKVGLAPLRPRQTEIAGRRNPVCLGDLQRVDQSGAGTERRREKSRVITPASSARSSLTCMTARMILLASP